MVRRTCRSFQFDLSPSLRVARPRRSCSPPPPRDPVAPVISRRDRCSRRIRSDAPTPPVCFAWLAEPSRAAVASSARAAMEPPPRPGRPSAAAHQPRSTVDRAPHARTRSTVDRPVPSRHVAGQAGHPAPLWLICKKALGLRSNQPAIQSSSK